MMVRSWLISTLLLAIAWGCELPRDPSSTHDNVVAMSRVRAGVVAIEPWVRIEAGDMQGIEVELLQKFAAERGLEIDWRHGSESELLERLERFELDVVLAGLNANTPWSGRVGLTSPFLTVHDKKHVWAVPPGENRWLLELDTFLSAQRTQARAMFDEARTP